MRRARASPGPGPPASACWSASTAAPGCRRAGPLRQARSPTGCRRPGPPSTSRPPATARRRGRARPDRRHAAAGRAAGRRGRDAARRQDRRGGRWPGRAPTTSPRSSSAASRARAGATWLDGSLPRELIREADDIASRCCPRAARPHRPSGCRRARAGERDRAGALPGRSTAWSPPRPALGWLVQDRRRPRQCLPGVRAAGAGARPGLGPVAGAGGRGSSATWPTTSSSSHPLYTFHDQRSRERRRPGAVLDRAALVASGLAARTRAQTLVARQEAARSAALYAFAKKLTGVAPSTTCSGPRPTRWR